MMMNLLSKFEQSDRALQRQQRGFERELILAYTASLKEIRGKLAEAYEKFNGSFTEMQKYNRLSNLERDIGKEIAKLTGKNAVTLKKGIGDTYQESYYRAGFTIETTAQAKLGFAQLSKKTIEASIDNPLDRVGWLKRNRENQALLTRQMKQQLTQSLIQGESFQQASRRIKNRMDVGATNVVRIAQTEMHRAQSAGRLGGLHQAASKGVIMKKVWSATLDSRTRDEHRDLDGSTIELDDNFVSEEGKGQAPGQLGSASSDINCRCSIVSVIDGYEPKLRRGTKTDAEYNRLLTEKEKELASLSKKERKKLIDSGKNPDNPKAFVSRSEIIPHKTYNEWKGARIGK